MSICVSSNCNKEISDTIFFLYYSMEEAKKNMYAFSTTTYTGFQCTVSEETSEKFKGKKICLGLVCLNHVVICDLKMNFILSDVGLPGVLWVLPDSYIDVKNKDYGGWLG